EGRASPGTRSTLSGAYIVIPITSRVNRRYSYYFSRVGLVRYGMRRHELLRRRLHPLFQLPQTAGEEVVGRLDPVQLLGGGEALIHRFQLGAGTELIVSALDEDLRGGAVLQVIGRAPARREPGGHQETGASRLTSQAGNDARAEGKAGQRVGEGGIAFAE